VINKVDLKTVAEGIRAFEIGDDLSDGDVGSLTWADSRPPETRSSTAINVSWCITSSHRNIHKKTRTGLINTSA
jgi:hypothetical protein